MSDFEMAVEVQTEYERGRADGIAHMRGLADDVLARSLADELEIDALKARIEDYKCRLRASPATIGRTREAIARIIASDQFDDRASWVQGFTYTFCGDQGTWHVIRDVSLDPGSQELYRTRDRAEFERSLRYYKSIFAADAILALSAPFNQKD